MKHDVSEVGSASVFREVQHVIWWTRYTEIFSVTGLVTENSPEKRGFGHKLKVFDIPHFAYLRVIKGTNKYE
jgi:hypothetical protein